MSHPLRLLAAAAASLLLSLVSPPIGWWWLQWVVLVPVFTVLDLDTPRRNRSIGLVYGAIGVGALFRWLIDTIDVYSNLPWIASAAILLLFSTVFGLQYVVFWGSVVPLRRRLGVLWIPAWGAVWVLVEFLLSQIVIFPYYFGTGQYRVPLLFQGAGVTGVMGLTFLLICFNGVLGEAVLRRRRGEGPFPGVPFALVSAALLLTALYGRARYEAVESALREAPVLKVAQLQTRYTMEERERQGYTEGFREWLRWTAAIPPGVVDLVVLPEGASPFSLNFYKQQKRNRARELVADAARRARADLLIGAGRRVELDGHREIYNSVFLFDRQGEVVGVYDKMVPLAFGEYFPFGEYLPGLSEMIGGIGDFRAGDAPLVLEGARGRYATPICYEAILPRTCARFDAPDLLVNVTNDAWFGDTAASYQHGMLAAVRATELGVPMFRSTYSGVSFVVEPHGHLYAETPLFEEVHDLVEVRLARFPTLYARYGDWFVGVCAVLLGGLWFGVPFVRGRSPGVTSAANES